MWPEQIGEEIYFDTLKSAKLSINQHINPGLSMLVDTDQHYSGIDETLLNQVMYISVGGNFWSSNTVDWAPAVGIANAGEVRADCAIEFAPALQQGSFESGGDYFTCVVKCRGGNFAVAGDNAGNIHVLNLTTGADIRSSPPAPTSGAIQRIFEGGEDTIFAWDQSGYVHWFTINKGTGVIGGITSYDFTTLTGFDSLIDVCKSPDGTRFIFTINKATTSDVYYTDQYRLTRAAPAPPVLYVSDMTQQIQVNDITGLTTQPMAFIDNSKIIVFSNTYTDFPAFAMGDIYVVDLNTAAPNGVQVNVNIPLASFDAVGFTNNGDYGILTGRIQDGTLGVVPPPANNTMQQESLIIWKIVVSGTGQDISIALTPLYRNRQDRIVSPIYRMFRMRKRHNSEQWFIISNEWGLEESEIGRLMAIGEMTESPLPTADIETSTSITLKWSKPTEFYSDENISYVRVMRSETCEPDDWGCVFASSDLPCEYVDIQHPTILPRDIEEGVGNNFVEAGLVDQVSAGDGGAGEIHSFDPTQDTFPDGRKFYYKVQWISYLGIVAESNVISGTTAKPIQPVHIEDSIPVFSEYDWTEPYENIDVQSDQFALNWDWLDQFDTTSESQFDRWEVAIFEAHENGAFAPEEIEPRWDGFMFVFPWRYNWAGSWLWMCDRGAVVTDPNTKSAIVKTIQNYDTGVLYEWPIIPYTVYRNVIVGWDKGGLWRASSTAERGEADWGITRQVVQIHTLPKPSGVMEIEDTEREQEYHSGDNEFLYKDWIDYEDAPGIGFSVGNDAGNVAMGGQEFTSTQEHTLVGYRIYVAGIVGAPSDLVIQLYDDAGGLPNALIAGSTVTVPTADVQTGTNTFYFVHPLSTTIYGRPYHVVVSTVLGGAEPLNNFYSVGAIVYANTTTHDMETYTGVGPWVNVATSDMQVGMICTGQASDSIVLNSGYVSTFHTDKTTDASMQNLIFTDLFDLDVGDWVDYYGTVSPTIASGYMEFVLGPLDSSYTRLDIENIGTETRNYIIKFDVFMVTNLQSFEILLRTQTEYLVTDYTALRLSHNGATGVWTLRQHHHSQLAGSVLAQSLGMVMNPDTWHTIIISVIDGAVTLFVDHVGAGVTALVNFQNGFSILKGRIINTVNYPFNDHGYPFIFGAIDNNETIRLDNFSIYGLPNTNEYSGGQGFFIDYGDKSESGYFSLYSIDKTYKVEPDDLLDAFTAITHPINEFGQEDIGIPDDNIDMQPSMSIDIKVINSYPVADIIASSIAYVDKTFYVDLGGSIDPDGGTLIYEIDWNDGTTDSGPAPRFNHTYTTVGTYIIDVYVTDELGQDSTTIHHTITVESLLNDLYELIPNFGFEKVTPSRASGSSVFNLPDQCGGETHATKGGSKKFVIHGVHIDPCCCNTLITDWTTIQTFAEISSWIESSSPGGGQAMEFVADDALFEKATRIKIRISLSRSADFDGDIECRLATSLNPVDEIFERGIQQTINNADIPINDGNNHYFDLEFYGCPIESDGNSIYFIVTPLDASNGSFRLRRSNTGTGYRKIDGSNTWNVHSGSEIYMAVSVLNDCGDAAICEHLLFDDLFCQGNPFKLYIPGFGEAAVIMTQYSTTKDKSSPKYMKYSMTVVEQSVEALMGG